MYIHVVITVKAKYVHYINMYACVFIYIYMHIFIHIYRYTHTRKAQPYGQDSSLVEYFPIHKLTCSLLQPEVGRIMVPPKCLCPNP